MKNIDDKDTVEAQVINSDCVEVKFEDTNNVIEDSVLEENTEEKHDENLDNIIDEKAKVKIIMKLSKMYQI